ncbi:MAG: hypothetical protein ACI87E_005334 [Mariniblastus sp.]|jgi:hypothetical protein
MWWRDTLTSEESAACEERDEAELGAKCARWLATGAEIHQRTKLLTPLEKSGARVLRGLPKWRRAEQYLVDF